MLTFESLTSRSFCGGSSAILRLATGPEQAGERVAQLSSGGQSYRPVEHVDLSSELGVVMNQLTYPRASAGAHIGLTLVLDALDATEAAWTGVLHWCESWVTPQPTRGQASRLADPRARQSERPRRSQPSVSRIAQHRSLLRRLLLLQGPRGKASSYVFPPVSRENLRRVAWQERDFELTWTQAHLDVLCTGPGEHACAAGALRGAGGRGRAHRRGRARLAEFSGDRRGDPERPPASRRRASDADECGGPGEGQLADGGSGTCGGHRRVQAGLRTLRAAPPGRAARAPPEVLRAEQQARGCRKRAEVPGGDLPPRPAGGVQGFPEAHVGGSEAGGL
eukprot:scaffold2688_cov235-Pinguiococcus_pyrenoidosus.AAC.3